MRCNLDGTGLELVAWGLRNPYGLGFSPDGRLLALDLGMNDRGSRPVGDAPSCLYAIEHGAWYGWPDFVAGVRVDDPRHAPARGPRPRMLLDNHAELPPPQRPLVTFPARTAAVKFTWGRDRLYVALFGDKRPFTAPPGPAAGRAVVRVDPRDGSIFPLVGSPLQRPIDVAFFDDTLYVLDFGEYELSVDGEVRGPGSSCGGKLWRLS
jgi:glucose/arabinose dehydrogenase